MKPFLLLLPLIAALALGNTASAADEPVLQAEVVAEPFTPGLPLFFFRVRLTNTRRDAVVRIVRPLPMAFAGQAPFYTSKVLDHTGAEPPRGMGCGNSLNNPKFPFDWHAEVVVLGGGLLEHDDEFPFEAPEEGYGPKVRFEMAAGATDWKRVVERSYYIRFESRPGMAGFT